MQLLTSQKNFLVLSICIPKRINGIISEVQLWKKKLFLFLKSGKFPEALHTGRFGQFFSHFSPKIMDRITDYESISYYITHDSLGSASIKIYFGHLLYIEIFPHCAEIAWKLHEINPTKGLNNSHMKTPKDSPIESLDDQLFLIYPYLPSLFATT